MESLQLVGGIVGLIAYVILIIKLFTTKTEQSFAAFFLWALLDAIATVTTFIEGGNYWLALSNVIGSSTVTIILIVKKQVSWTWVETMTAILVLICLGVWYTSGEIAGIIASSLAVVAASIPQMVDTYKNPSGTPTISYSVFLVANFISFFGGKDWSIEERFYAGCSIFLVVIIIVFSLRRRNQIPHAVGERL